MTTSILNTAAALAVSTSFGSHFSVSFTARSPIQNLAISVMKIFVSTLLTSPKVAAIPYPDFYSKCMMDDSDLGYRSYPTCPSSNYLNCRSFNCFDLDEIFLRSEEKRVIKTLDTANSPLQISEAQEYFRLRSDDTREKAIVLSPLSMGIDPMDLSNILLQLNNKLDLQYALFSSVDEMCKIIEEGAKTGKLVNIYVAAFDEDSLSTVLYPDIPDLKSCFKGLQDSGKIILLGFDCGSPKNGDPYDNIAQTIAVLGQKTVVAFDSNDDQALIDLIETINPFAISGSSPNNPQQGIFKTFYPDCDATTKSTSSNPNCVCPPCPDLDEQKLHPRELTAMQILSVGKQSFKETQEALRLQRDDERDKLLFLVAPPSTDKDEYGNDKNVLIPPRIIPLLKGINQKCDIKYKIISSYDEVCKEIKDAAKVGRLANVVIEGHGIPRGTCLANECQSWNDWLSDFNSDLSSCFEGLQPSGRVALISCNVGALEGDDAYNNFAHRLAEKTKRTVLAARSFVYPDYVHLLSEDPLMLYHSSESHPSRDIPDSNIFRIFQSHYPTCSNMEWNKLHDRELVAIEAINEYYKSRSHVPFSPDWAKSQEHVRLCKEDPKDKLLFLSAAYDPNKQMDPRLNPEFFGRIADKFDWKYKVVKKANDICDEITKASKLGKLRAVILQGYYDPTTENRLVLWRETDPGDPSKKEELVLNKIEHSCVSALDPSSAIFLLSANQKFDFNTIQKIANEIQMTIITSDIYIPFNQQKIRSFEPFALTSTASQSKHDFREFYPY